MRTPSEISIGQDSRGFANISAPKFFLSHASEDKTRIEVDFARRFRENGLDAWLDQWEMKLGDSWWTGLRGRAKRGVCRHRRLVQGQRCVVQQVREEYFRLPRLVGLEPVWPLPNPSG